MCLVQPSSLYNFYLSVYAFIILTLTRTYIKIHHLWASPIFISVGTAKHLHKFSLIRYPWTITTYTLYFTVIPLHCILMSEIESLKATFEQQTRDIVQEMRNEYNERNAGADLHKAGCVLDKMNASNEYFLSKLENLLGKSNSNYDGEVVIANDYFILNNVIDHQEEL